MPIVTVMLCLIARIATAIAMVFPIARTAARTTLAATNSKRQHRTLLTLFCRTHFHKSAAPDAYLDTALRATRHERDLGFGIRNFFTGDINECNIENCVGSGRSSYRRASGCTGHLLRT
jgi:hypothetical protein